MNVRPLGSLSHTGTAPATIGSTQSFNIYSPIFEKSILDENGSMSEYNCLDLIVCDEGLQGSINWNFRDVLCAPTLGLGLDLAGLTHGGLSRGHPAPPGHHATLFVQRSGIDQWRRGIGSLLFVCHVDIQSS